MYNYVILILCTAHMLGLLVWVTTPIFKLCL